MIENIKQRASIDEIFLPNQLLKKEWALCQVLLYYS